MAKIICAALSVRSLKHVPALLFLFACFVIVVTVSVHQNPIVINKTQNPFSPISCKFGQSGYTAT